MDEIVDLIFDIAIKYEKKTLIEMALKASEELGELSQAILSYQKVHGCGYKELGLEDVNEEACDVLIVVMAMISRAQISKEEMKTMLHKKLDKWMEKSASIPVEDKF